MLEQSAVVWHTSLTEANKQDIERVQKTATKIILKNKYITYNKSLEDLSLDSLDVRRNKLCKDFALKSLHKSTLPFEYNTKVHQMIMRNTEPIKVTNCHTERLKHSSIPQMQRILNSVM